MFKLNGYTYNLHIRPWKKPNKGKYEALKWKTGFRFTWERISYNEYKQALKQYNNITT